MRSFLISITGSGAGEDNFVYVASNPTLGIGTGKNLQKYLVEWLVTITQHEDDDENITTENFHFLYHGIHLNSE